jgi:multiple sugar transport system permease protein
VFYRVWHVAPFAFVVFYAGLQTVNQDTLEAAIIDGASRLGAAALRHHPAPDAADRLRRADPPDGQPTACSRRSSASPARRHVISLQWLTYDFLTPDDARQPRAISRASASAMLTMIGIVILLIPLLRRTWRDHKGGALDVHDLSRLRQPSRLKMLHRRRFSPSGA